MSGGWEGVRVSLPLRFVCKISVLLCVLDRMKRRIPVRPDILYISTRVTHPR